MTPVERRLKKLDPGDRDLGHEMLQRVPVDGSTIGNVTLRKDLRLISSEQRFWDLRNQLIDLGLLERSGGRGGSVRLTEEARPQGPVTYEPLRERELYIPMRCVLRNHWVREEEYVGAVAADTADQGRRPTGGRWTRPDLLVVGVRRYGLLPRIDVEAITFEVKTFAAADVTAVYEAVAHRVRAHRAYLLIHWPPTLGMGRRLQPIEHAAREHGIGLILANDPHDFGQWETRLPAMRVEPDPHALDNFLLQQLREDEAEALRRLLASDPRPQVPDIDLTGSCQCPEPAVAVGR